MTEEKEIKEAYRQYQLSTQGIDIWEEGSFRAGWIASKNLFKPDIIKSVCPSCEGTGKVQQTDIDWDECRRCNGTGQTVL